MNANVERNLVTIAENRQKIYNAGGLHYSPKGITSGEVVSISDVAPVEHNMAVKLGSKNIYNPIGRITPQTDNGLTIQYLEDEDCYLLNGTPTTDGGYYQLNETVLVDDYISFTCEVISGSVNNPDNRYMMFYLGYKDSEESTSVANWTSVNLKNSTNISKTAQKYIGRSWFYISGGVTFDNYKVKISVEKGTKATTYTPYIDISTVKVNALGKNLFGGEFEIGGIAGSSGNNYNNVAQIRNVDYIPIYTGDYVCSLFNDEYVISAIFLYDANKTMITSGTLKNISTLLKTYKNTAYYRFRIARADGANITEEDLIKVKSAIQLEVGTEATPYEPYKGTTYTPNADGTVEDVKSIYPTTTLVPSEQGVLVECEYYQDARKVKQDLTDMIISLGGIIDV